MVFHKRKLQRFVAQLLFRLGEMRLAALREVHRVRKGMVELLAGQVEHGIAYSIETMVVAIAVRHAIHLAPEDVLNKKCRDGTLPAGWVGRAPFLLHTRRARLAPPEQVEGTVPIGEK